MTITISTEKFEKSQSYELYKDSKVILHVYLFKAFLYIKPTFCIILINECKRRQCKGSQGVISGIELLQQNAVWCKATQA